MEAVKKFVVGSVWEKIGSLQIILRQKCVSFGDESRIQNLISEGAWRKELLRFFRERRLANRPHSIHVQWKWVVIGLIYFVISSLQNKFIFKPVQHWRKTFKKLDYLALKVIRKLTLKTFLHEEIKKRVQLKFSDYDATLRHSNIIPLYVDYV